MIRSLLTAGIAAITIAGAQASAAPVFFEGFENPDIGQRWNVYDGFGQFVTTEGMGIEVQRSGTVVAAYEGNQYIELDSDNQVSPYGDARGSNTSMAALVDLVAGQRYEVNFAYRPRTNTIDDNGISVAIGSLAGRSFTMSQSLGDVDARRSDQNAWRVVTMVFTALTGDNAVQFAAFGRENELGGFIDAVEIEAVPLPAGALLFATGGLIFARRRRAAAA
jgi:hypothetical protein